MGYEDDNDDDNMCHDTIHRYLMIGQMHGQKAGDWAKSLHVHGYDIMKRGSPRRMYCVAPGMVMVESSLFHIW